MIPLDKTAFIIPQSGFTIIIVPVETIVATFALPAVTINDGSLIVHVTDWEKKTATTANVKQINLLKWTALTLLHTMAVQLVMHNYFSQVYLYVSMTSVSRPSKYKSAFPNLIKYFIKCLII